MAKFFDRFFSFLPIFVILFLVISGCSKKQKSNLDQCADDDLQCIIDNATFSDLEGNAVQPSDFKGKIVLIDFWESWCGPCLQVFPAMDRLLEEHPEKFAVIAVNLGYSDSIADVSDFKTENGYNFNYVMDSRAVLEKIGVPGIPYKIFIDPDGKIIKAEMGSRGTKGDYEYARNLIVEQNS